MVLREEETAPAETGKGEDVGQSRVTGPQTVDKDGAREGDGGMILKDLNSVSQELEHHML